MTYATYNIIDDKIRLSLGYKPNPEQVAAMRQAGFTWWPASRLNVAKWSTAAEDYVLGLGIEIEDDDRPDDVAARVDRFSGYAESAASNADSASRYAHNLLSPIPAGQPVLVGHYSARSHNATLKRADAAMQRAVSETEREAHWRGRIAAAIAHAEYKERPDVIARRIKGLEADERTYLRELESQDTIRAQIFLNMRENVRKQLGAELAMSGEVIVWIKANEGIFNVELEKKYAQVWGKHERWATRWLEHIRKRLEYERALLEAVGGSPKLKWDLQVGGQVEYAGNWHRIIRLNKKSGEIVSVTVDTKRYGNRLEVGGITGYLEPTTEDITQAKAKTKRPPLCNYPGEGFVEITQEEWDKCPKDYKGTRIIQASNGVPTHSARVMIHGHRYPFVFIKDAKVKYPA